MTSGLDDGVPENHCTLDTCLNYLADAGTRWAYHNAPYTLLDDVLTSATGTSLNTYTQTRLKSKTGMKGIWLTLGYNNVYFSDARSMARFGLLIQNNCNWGPEALLEDAAYINQMTSTSQDLNKSYGYLWWLNGKSSFMLPTSQLVFPGFLCPAAPADMFTALGKNGQILSVSRSEGLVVVRMGNQASGNEVPTQLCNGIWERLNALACGTTSSGEVNPGGEVIPIYPNPASTEVSIGLLPGRDAEVLVSNTQGVVLLRARNQGKIDISGLVKGLYFVTVTQGQTRVTKRLVKQ
jgi:CubicO group peptidase (beta-lactamase class C family)